MLLSKKLVDESQMPQSQDYTDTFIIIYKEFLVGLQGLYFISNPDGRPCKKAKVWKGPIQLHTNKNEHSNLITSLFSRFLIRQ